MSIERDTRLVSILIASPTIKQAAKTAGISERRIYQRLQEPEFSRLYYKACSNSLRQATAELQKANTSAINALVNIAGDKKQPSAARVTACRTILEYSLRLTEITELQERISALEAVQRGETNDSV